MCLWPWSLGRFSRQYKPQTSFSAEFASEAVANLTRIKILCILLRFPGPDLGGRQQLATYGTTSRAWNGAFSERDRPSRTRSIHANANNIFTSVMLFVMDVNSAVMDPVKHPDHSPFSPSSCAVPRRRTNTEAEAKLLPFLCFNVPPDAVSIGSPDNENFDLVERGQLLWIHPFPAPPEKYKSFPRPQGGVPSGARPKTHRRSVLPPYASPDSETHSRMRSIRTTNTKLEQIVRQLLNSIGISYQSTRLDLPGRPDFVVPSMRTAIFVHGCFWHGHSKCTKGRRRPIRNSAFWKAKVAYNTRRDAEVRTLLRALGWRTIVIWECTIKDGKTVQRYLHRLRGGSNDGRT